MLGMVGSASAATTTYNYATNATNNSLWNTAANWSNNAVPTSSSNTILQFTTNTVATITITNDLSGMVVNGLLFTTNPVNSGASAYTINGSQLSLTNNDVNTNAFLTITASGKTETLNIALALQTDTVVAGNFNLYGVVSGTGGLTINSGTVNLTNNNTYSGLTTINGGTLNIGNSTGTSGTLGTGNVTDNATLNFNRKNAYTVTNAITGSGAVTQGASGTVTLSGANGYSGKTTISAGTMIFASTNSLYSATTNAWSAANIVVASGATLGLSVGTNSGAFAANEVASLYKGLTNSSTTAGFAAGSAIAFDATGTNFVLNTQLADSAAGTLGLITLGTGTLTLANNNSYSGGTLINSGTALQLGNGGSTGTLNSAATITNNGTLAFNRTGTLILPNAVTGSGNTTFDGGGTNLSSANGTFSSGSVTVATNTTLELVSGGASTNRTLANAITLNGGTIQGGIADNTGTGGTIIVDTNGVTHVFTSSGTIALPATVTANELIVGGGASGNGFTTAGGGGGGGGQVKNLTGQTLINGTTITVGSGGTAPASLGLAGTSGGQSAIGAITASGGVGPLSTTNDGGASGSIKSGGSGGSGNSGGGGGGDSVKGGNANAGVTAGTGGKGSSNNVINGLAGYGYGDVSGGLAYFGGGGGGGSSSGANAAGGLGGGGTGGASAGTANTGGGGSGGNKNVNPGRAGGSGIAVVQYTYNSAASAGTLTLSGGITLGSGTSTLDAYGSGGLVDVTGSITGSGALNILSSQSSGGVVRFSTNNSYTGKTTIGGGSTLALNANGTLASTNISLGLSSTTQGTLDLTNKSSYTLTSGQTLSGYGTVNIGSGKTLTLNGGVSPGTLATTNSGILSVAGNVVLGSTATTTMQIYSNTVTGYDQLIVTGSLTYGGALNIYINTNAYTPTINQTYQLFTNTTGESGDFTQVNLANSWTGAFTDASGIWSFTDSTHGIQWTLNDLNGQLTTAAVPEPRELVFLGGAVSAAVLFYRRRKARQNS
jgi:hypothetical protein